MHGSVAKSASQSLCGGSDVRSKGSKTILLLDRSRDEPHIEKPDEGELSRAVSSSPALPPRLRRFFATTNCIENLIGIVRHVTRNVKR